jgi:hypothetical protein
MDLLCLWPKLQRLCRLQPVQRVLHATRRNAARIVVLSAQVAKKLIGHDTAFGLVPFCAKTRAASRRLAAELSRLAVFPTETR